jgi:urease accessory protein UreF
MQFRFSAIAERLLADSVSLAVEALAQTAPLLDLWQGTQDRLYSRLFQS